MHKRTLIIVFAALLLILGGAAFAFRVEIRDVITESAAPDLPQARTYTPPSAEDAESEGSEPAAQDAPGDTEEPSVFRQETEKEADPEGSAVSGQESPPEAGPPSAEAVNWSVPFTPQAPHANWNLPYQEACEEASLLMVNAWMTGESAGLMDPDVADRLILDLVAWQEDRFGYYEDTNAEETATIAREYYGHEGTEVLPVTSMDDVRTELAKGHPVILPAAGQKLHNPYFRGAGPLYHMIVAKGYTEDGRIITNDPGTRRGEDFLYDPDTLFEALGDWNDGDPASGEKLMIVVRP